MKIERNFMPELSVWDIKMPHPDDVRGHYIEVHVWDDGDIIFDLDFPSLRDYRIHVSILTEILAAANDYWVARTNWINAGGKDE